MAGQFLEPENEITVQEIYEEACENNYTKHGEMFSAKNMAKLAQTMYTTCQAEKVTESSILTNLEKLLEIIGKDEKLIMVPYDSDADQWPCTKKGERAHWGLVIGVALILPYRNKAFNDAVMLDGYVSHLKPPLSQKVLYHSVDIWEFVCLSREINFGWFQKGKNCHFKNFGGLELRSLGTIHFQNSQSFTKIQFRAGKMVKMIVFDLLKLAKFDFT